MFMGGTAMLNQAEGMEVMKGLFHKFQDQEGKMKKIILLILGFLLAIGCATTGGLQKQCVSSAKIEKVQFKPDKQGDYYVYVTVQNISGEAKPFYMLIQAEDQPPQLTASGPKGEPNPIGAGQTYTFELNTLLKVEPKNIFIEIMDKLPR